MFNVNEEVVITKGNFKDCRGTVKAVDESVFPYEVFVFGYSDTPKAHMVNTALGYNSDTVPFKESDLKAVE